MCAGDFGRSHFVGVKVHGFPCFGFLAGFCVENAKSHVQWSEVQLTVDVERDAIHAENYGNENLVR